jgi:hypothetical protein
MATGKVGAAAGGVAMKTGRQRPAKVKRRKQPATPPRQRSSAADLQKQLDQRTRELAEALEQQAATSEILRSHFKPTLPAFHKASTTVTLLHALARP